MERRGARQMVGGGKWKGEKDGREKYLGKQQYNILLCMEQAGTKISWHCIFFASFRDAQQNNRPTETRKNFTQSQT